MLARPGRKPRERRRRPCETLEVAVALARGRRRFFKTRFGEGEGNGMRRGKVNGERKGDKWTG